MLKILVSSSNSKPAHKRITSHRIWNITHYIWTFSVGRGTLLGPTKNAKWEITWERENEQKKKTYTTHTHTWARRERTHDGRVCVEGPKITELHTIFIISSGQMCVLYLIVSECANDAYARVNECVCMPSISANCVCIAVFLPQNINVFCLCDCI